MALTSKEKMMDKWEEYKTYENWKQSNHSELTREYENFIENKYSPAMPESFVHFDDFCMGRWQGL